MGYVYVVQAEVGGPVKIGVTSDIDRRLAEFQASCPFRLRVRRAWLYDNPRMIEQILHARLQQARLHGEWFDDTHPAVAEFLSWPSPEVWLKSRMAPAESSLDPCAGCGRRFVNLGRHLQQKPECRDMAEPAALVEAVA